MIGFSLRSQNVSGHAMARISDMKLFANRFSRLPASARQRHPFLDAINSRTTL
jgi:hypothetical protein